MNRRRITALLRKEWIDLRQNRMLVMAAVLLPTVLLLNFLPTSLALEHGGSSGQDSGLPLPPELEALGPRVALAVQMNDLAILMLMLTPSVLPMLIGCYSIVGEKRLKSLEPLLASPVTTGELLFVKGVAAAAVPMLLAWLSYGIYLGGLALGASAEVLSWALRPALLLGMIVLTPLVALLATFIAVTASARSQDPRAAQAWAMIIAFPLMAMSFSAFAGVLIDLTIMSVASGVVGASCVVTYRLAIWLFRREVILTRWK